MFLTKPGRWSRPWQTPRTRSPGIRAKLTTTGGTSDARFIKDYCPVVELGLVNATIHQVDERVPVADLGVLTQIYARFIERFFATA